MDDEAKAKGLIASSAGNHAQGVAYAASKLGVKATIVMPQHTPLIKVEATEAHGAEVVLAGEVYDEAYQKACDLQRNMDIHLCIHLMMKMLLKGKEQLR